jgi:hypothetical protein
MPRLQKGERHPGAGRKPGQPNKSTWKIEEILRAKNCNPHEVMMDIMLGNVECNKCRGKLKTAYVLPDGTHTKECKQNQEETGIPDCICNGIGERECQSCNRSGYEHITPELRGKMAAELAQYISPKRKAIEHTGPEGGPMEHSLVVEFVSSPKLLTDS